MVTPGPGAVAVSLLLACGRPDASPGSVGGAPPVALVPHGVRHVVDGCAGDLGAPLAPGSILLAKLDPLDAMPLVLERDADGRLGVWLLGPEVRPFDHHVWLSVLGHRPAEVRIRGVDGTFTCRPEELALVPATDRVRVVEVEVGALRGDDPVLVAGCGGHAWTTGRSGRVDVAIEPSVLPCALRAAHCTGDGPAAWGPPVVVERSGQEVRLVIQSLGIAPIGAPGLF